MTLIITAIAYIAVWAAVWNKAMMRLDPLHSAAIATGWPAWWVQSAYTYYDYRSGGRGGE